MVTATRLVDKILAMRVSKSKFSCECLREAMPCALAVLAWQGSDPGDLVWGSRDLEVVRFWCHKLQVIAFPYTAIATG